MHDDAARWDDRYRSAPPPAPVAPEPLDRHVDLLGSIPLSGVAIDIACGLGRQSLWLAHRGLDVVALDVSPIALEALDAAAIAAGVDSRISTQLVDVDDGLPPEPASVAVVVCQRFHHPTIHPQIVQRLAPGGVAIVTVLSVVGADSAGPFHAPPGELTAAFAELDLLYEHEGNGEATVVARRRWSAVNHAGAVRRGVRRGESMPVRWCS